MNIKVVVRLIQGEKVGAFAHATILTADDGTTAIEQLRNEMSAGRQVDFVLTDFVMVLEKFQVVIIALSLITKLFSSIDYTAWAGGRPNNARGAPVQGVHHR